MKKIKKNNAIIEITDELISKNNKKIKIIKNEKEMILSGNLSSLFIRNTKKEIERKIEKVKKINHYMIFLKYYCLNENLNKENIFGYEENKRRNSI